MPRSDNPAMSPVATDALGNELVEIVRASYGTGAGRVTIRRCGDALVAFLDELELQPGERFLIDHGRAETVVRTRAAYEQKILSTFAAAVERATGRRVVSFVSNTHLEPPYAIEVFRLAPSAAP